MTEKLDAKAALDTVRATDAKLAERMHWPLWRHAIVGLLLALLLLGIALPFDHQILISFAVIGIVFLVIHDDKKRYGMFVSGYQRGRTGWVLAVQVLLFIGALLLANIYVDRPLANPLFWSIEAVLFVGSTVLSVLWERVYRADLRAGRA